ncbi:hypothetical protein DPMN_163035 [Dreissena polymorpha]|uniref:Uncharacterized protein n=1 Tax=Dreissena polymorpha TaxID=45954 RepID=A0A9D4ERD6_DREPO|nr:hypothetical protein DPMN_163035 [Dreissena polymorpha]
MLGVLKKNDLVIRGSRVVKKESRSDTSNNDRREGQTSRNDGDSYNDRRGSREFLNVRSECHKEAAERLVTLPTTTRDAGETLSAGHAKEKANNRNQLSCCKSYAAYGSSSHRASRYVGITTIRETSCSCYNTTVML